MSDLTVLRNMKTALDEGLITQQDFDQVKLAFLKAQQIKAGLDAGFIREEEYERTRDAFLTSLDFRIPNAPVKSAAANGAGDAQPRAAASAAAPPQRRAPHPFFAAPGNAAAAALSQAPAPAASYTSPPAPVPTPAPFAAATAAAGTAFSSDPAQGGPRQEALADVPTDIPKTTKGTATVGKKSMAGIGVHEDVVNIFQLMKTRQSYKWVIYKVDDSGREVNIERLGAKDSAYQDFLASLPEDDCRYAVYDWNYTKADGQIVGKLVFMFWAPDGANVKAKMTYASTKDFMKGFMDGIGADMQASDLDEIDEQAVNEKIYNNLTRK